MGDLFQDRPSMKKTLAEGLLFSSGDAWTKNREVYMEVFHSKNLISDMELAIQTELDIAVDYLQLECDRPVKIGYMMLKACINAIAGFLIGEPLPVESSDRIDLLKVAGNLGNMEISASFKKFSTNMPRFRRLMHALSCKRNANVQDTNRILQTLVRKWISDVITKQKDVERDTALSAVLKWPVYDETSENSDKELLQSVIDLFYGGVTSTSSAMEFILLYLCKNPTIQQWAQQEIDLIANARRGEITWAMRPQLPYLHACIIEGLRLGSVAYRSWPHVAVKDTEIEDYAIPKGSLVFASIYSLHYDPKYYTEPTMFKPERHFNKHGLNSLPNSYRPYGVGPRRCVGSEMAEMQLFLYTATLLRHFTLHPIEKTPASEMETHVRIFHKLKDFKCVLQRRWSVDL